MTMTITATDDNGITAILPTWADGPNGADVYFKPGCTVGPIEPDANGRAVIDVGCDVPAIMSNGNWSLFFYVADGATSLPLGEGRANFTVTGGSSDYSPPVVTDTVIPAAPGIGETFQIKALIEDETGPISGEFGFVYGTMTLRQTGSASITCALVKTQLSPTSWEYAYTCVPDTAGLSGTYAWSVEFADGLNQITDHEFSVNVG